MKQSLNPRRAEATEATNLTRALNLRAHRTANRPSKAKPRDQSSVHRAVPKSSDEQGRHPRAMSA